MFTALLVGMGNVKAQDTPSDVSDLVGSRASSGESVLRSRGYRFIKTTKSDDRSYSNWWKSSNRTCITIATVEGRYDTIVTSPAPDCNQSAGGNSGEWNGGNNSGWNGGNSGGGQTSNPPSWARGTFYSSNPNVTMTIANNGQVTSVIDGQTYYGRFYRGTIYSNDSSATVTRDGNGIRTYNTVSGQTIYFTKNSGGNNGNWNNGNNGGWTGSGQTSNPPSWARGTFYSSNPNVTMTISNNGQVTSIVDGQTYTGRYYQGTIYSNDSSATVTRNGNGIRTYNTVSGQTIYFTKNSGGNNGSWNNGNSSNNVDFRYLAGEDAANGERELQNMGFRNVRGRKSGSTSYTFWLNDSSGQCVQAATRNGKYSSVITTSAQNCR